MNGSEGAVEYAIRVLRRRKFVILAALISVPLFAFAYSAAQTEEYTATATLLFESDNEPGFGEASRESATIEALAGLPAIAVQAAERLDIGVGEVLGSVEVSSANENANISTISATNESPERAAEVANAYSQAFIAFQRASNRAQVERKIAVIEAQVDGLSNEEAAGSKGEALQDQLTQLEVEAALQTGNLSLVQEASAPTSPSSPKTSRNVAVGLLFGLVLGLSLAALIERLDRRVRGVDELEELFGLPVIARIPKTKSFRNAGADLMATAPEFEAFRTLRTNLRYLHVDRELDSLLIASPEPNDGKSTVARGLAAAMAEVGDDVVLVEADLRKESSFRYGNGYVHDGLSGVLSGTPLDAALIQIPVTHDRSQERSLNVLPCGPIPPNPSELLESGKMVEIVEELKSRFGMILIDSPAIGVVGDATSLVPLCSAMVVVGGVGRTTREGAKGFVDQLELIGSRPLGLVATFTNTSRKQYSYYRRTSPLAR